MSKDELSEWDSTAANNTDVGGISIAEGMSPADVNGAMREMMAQLAADYGATAWREEGADVPSDSLDAITESGIYTFTDTDTGVPITATGVVLHLQRAASRAIQIAGTATGTSRLKLFWRERSGEGLSAWREVMHGQLGAGALTHFTDDGLTVSATETNVINAAAAAYGVSAAADGTLTVARSNNVAARIKRSNDGSILHWYVGTTVVGGVSASGGVVTYGSFCGVHWAQFKSMARPHALPGTILETIDRLCEWEDGEETVLPQVVVASPGSRRVYGVFSHWDEGTRDLHVASLGAYSVRIAPRTLVRRGDLIEAGPDGCGVVQADDIFRASTVAKVTAAVVTKTYPDGSYLVPCTLHCG